MKYRTNFVSTYRTIIIAALTILSLSLSSCKKENGMGASETDEYYVKYVYESRNYPGYMGGSVILRMRLENGFLTNDTISTGGKEVVIGPVQKGFEGFLSLRDLSGSDKRLYTEIHVSKNGSPFALKSSDISEAYRELVTIEYTIDY